MNPENIPSQVFDWLENHSFSSLSEEQKKEVLNHFTEQEYDELHINTRAIESSHEPVFSENRDAIKQDLLSKFENRHAVKRSGFVFYNTFWKAAAAVVLLACGWVLNYLIPGKTADENGLVSNVDTVYLTKEVISDPMKIYDTLYIEKTSPGSKSKSSNNSYGGNRHITPTPENNSALYLEEVGSTLNRQKRNSMKDDSLLKEFSAILL